MLLVGQAAVCLPSVKFISNYAQL